MKTSQYININTGVSTLGLIVLHPAWFPASFWTILPWVLLVTITLGMIVSTVKSMQGD